MCFLQEVGRYAALNTTPVSIALISFLVSPQKLTANGTLLILIAVVFKLLIIIDMVLNGKLSNEDSCYPGAQ